MTAKAEWVRKHSDSQAVGTQDYIRFTVGTDGGEVTLYLSPDQVNKLADELRYVAYDRDVVMGEEAKASAVQETAGGG